MRQLKKEQPIHFIGIGGAGMSGLARVLLSRGFSVTGSDMKGNFWTRKLSSMGADIFLDHKRSHLSSSCQCVVISTAIKKDNPELLEARKLGVPVWHRSEMLNLLVQDRRLFTVAGTHGKTTTSSMLTTVFERNNLDPVVFIGAEFDEIQGNAKDGQGEYAVIEADESDGTFLNYYPFASIITNVDRDHMEFYGSYQKILDYFSRYIKQHDEKGMIILCGDDPGIDKVLEGISNPHPSFYSYGVEDHNDFIIRHINMEHQPVTYELYHQNEYLASIPLLVPGMHNIYNSAAVFALCWLNGKLKAEDIVNSLSCFRGAQRRFQIKGEMNNIVIIDDYGHHPREIQSTIQSAIQFNRSRGGRLFVVFQPHRFSRTQYFMEEFAAVFEGVDSLYLMDVYGAGEASIAGVNSQVLFEKIKNNEHSPSDTVYSGNHQQTVQQVYDSFMPGDTIITIGAGDVYRVGEELFDKLRDG